MRLLLCVLFVAVVFALPHSIKKAATRSPKQPKSPITNWKHDLTHEEREILLQLETEMNSAKDEKTKSHAQHKHHHAALHMITSRQKKHAQEEFHARQHARRHHTHQKARAVPNYDSLPADIKAVLVPNGDPSSGQYIIHSTSSAVTDLYFRFDGTNWEWSPDQTNWNDVGHEIVRNGDYAGASPVQINIDLLNRLSSIEKGLDTLGARKYDSIKWYFRGFISTAMPGGHWINDDEGCSLPTNVFVGPLPRIPTINLAGVRCFATDSRDHDTSYTASSRFHINVEIGAAGVNIAPSGTDASNPPESVTSPYSDYSSNYVCKDSMLTLSDCGHQDCHQRADSSHLHIDNLICYDGTTWSTTCDGNSVLATFHLYGDPSDPCIMGSPGVDFYAGFTIAIDGHLYGDGAVDEYPWYESGVVATTGGVDTPTTVWTLDPNAGATAFDLIGPANRVFHVAGEF